MRNGETVAAFERAFAEYVGARFAIALCNGTATLHTALVALGVKPGDRVAVPPLTMSATTLAVLQAGAVPAFCDVLPDRWTMDWSKVPDDITAMPVSLYGLTPFVPSPVYSACTRGIVDDAAQRLSEAWCPQGFTSYSFQASKILPLGEGGMLVTDSEELATRAREFSSLGYRMRPDQPRIDPAVLKSPTFERHHWPLAFNYRMADLVAEKGLNYFDCSQSFAGQLDDLKAERRKAAALYREAIAGCAWLTPQHVPEGWHHSWWAYAVALDFDRMPLGRRGQVAPGSHWHDFAHLIVKHGGEMPYGAWRLTYQEPAFGYLRPGWKCHRCRVWQRPEVSQPSCSDCGDEHSEPLFDWQAPCPVAEDLQPRLLQFQTNDLQSAERNADALRKAIREIGG